ncbi:DoxX family protein [Kovacikia minuta CCNUW1]|uniref:DoxX family protein n=1 Tax=Kovacikia minuta TaxID=2931930 RepID=UPI001CCBD7B7|nr:DoxX family protein [Kovacikia minuta]UBF28340.1 DoxX family protein [Kovacikia minuta CCNUW1]
MAKAQAPIWLRHRDLVTAYTLLRIVLGVNFFNHGFTRLGNIPGFADSMVQLFQKTAVPEPLVRGPALLVPIIEFVVGFLVTLGLLTRPALVTGFGLMIMLMYGVTLLQNWDTATSQLIYCLVFFILIAANRFNTFSIDALLERRRHRQKAKVDI